MIENSLSLLVTKWATIVIILTNLTVKMTHDAINSSLVNAIVFMHEKKKDHICLSH